LTSMGAINISRKKYLAILQDALKHEDHTEHWSLDV
jgi:Leu/Phe-tRNA-protein transferase